MAGAKDFARHPRGVVQRARVDAWLVRRALKLAFGKRARGDVVDQFHRLYYDGAVFGDTRADTSWLGVPADKCPLDLWVYQELLFRLRPGVVVETGTANGGSALFFASMFDLLGEGEVVTVDVEGHIDRPEHDRITYVTGSSIDAGTVDRVRELVGGREAMVFLDSDHRRDHVLAELRAYHPFVPAGGYLVVEDTNLNGRPVSPDYGPGPGEAVDDFLRERSDFVRDRDCEKLYMTFNPGGYLRHT